LAPTINVSASSSSDDDDCDEAFLGLCWVPWGALVVAVAGVVFLVCVAGAAAACAGGGAAPKTIETKPTFTPSDAPPPGRPLVPPETTYPPDDGGAEEEKASPVRPLVYEPEEESVVPLDEPLAPPTPVTPFVFEDVEPRERALVPPSPGAAWHSNLQPDFNVRICGRFDARSSAVLRELDESNRFVQKSAESTSI
jgi:hypothetical protein